MSKVSIIPSQQKILKVTHKGILIIGDIQIPCAVLEDGTRVLSERAIAKIFSSGPSGKNYRLKKEASEENDQIPLFLTQKALKPLIDKVFGNTIPIIILCIDGKQIKTFCKEEVLSKVCELLFQARDLKILQKQQLPQLKKAETLMRGLAHIGLTALIDEVTGFQYDRPADTLSKELQTWLEKQKNSWVKTFSDEYYSNIYRLKGISEEERPIKGHAQWVGYVTGQIVYARLAPNLLEELKKRVPKLKSGKRSYTFHQCLTTAKGHPKLREYLSSLITIMKLSSCWEEFKDKLDVIHPNQNLLF